MPDPSKASSNRLTPRQSAPRGKQAVPRHGQVRPGGRTEQVRKRVAASVLALIQAGRFDFSYNEVADASGVNKTTLYRRWPQRSDLMKEALSEHNSSLRFPKATNWPDTAEALVRELVVFLSKPTEMAMNIALLSDPTGEGAALNLSQWEPIQERIVQFARDAQANGQISQKVDPKAITLLLMAPVVVLTLLQRSIPIDKKLLNEYIKLVRTMRFPE